MYIYIYNFAFGNDDKMILSITNVFFFLEFTSLKLREEGIKFRISDIVRPREREKEKRQPRLSDRAVCTLNPHVGAQAVYDEPWRRRRRGSASVFQANTWAR